MKPKTAQNLDSLRFSPILSLKPWTPDVERRVGGILRAFPQKGSYESYVEDFQEPLRNKWYAYSIQGR